MVTTIIALLALSCGVLIGVMMKVITVERNHKDDDDFTGDQL